MAHLVTSARIVRVAFSTFGFRLLNGTRFVNAITVAVIFKAFDVVRARVASGAPRGYPTLIATIIIGITALSVLFELAIVIAAFVQALTSVEAGVTFFVCFDAVVPTK